MIRIVPSHKNKLVQAHISQSVNLFGAGLRAGLAEVGRENQRYCRKIIEEGPKTGVKYSSLPNRSSAPYEAPADQSGKLKKGVSFNVYSESRMEFGDTVLHGKFLEGGTKTKAGKVKMKPRPHLKTTVDARQGDNFITLANTVYRNIK